MIKPTCRWREGCDKPTRGRGLCKQHHQRATRNGSLSDYAEIRACEKCDGPLPVGSRTNRRFCSTRCCNSAAWKTNQQELLQAHRVWRYATADARRLRKLQAKAGRSCEECEGPLPADARWNRRFCSGRCINARSLRLKIEERKSATHRRRALLRNAPIYAVTPRDWRRILDHYRGRCTYCGKAGSMTQDHAIPLARGGSHSIGNLVPACGPCNSGKKARLPIEWRIYLVAKGRI